MLTIARLHGESVSYYESTVAADSDAALGPDGYYSEDGTKPARGWVVAKAVESFDRVCDRLGVENGARVRGESVRDWFNKALAPSGEKLGRAPGARGVPGFDLTFCAPKSVSLVWGLTRDAEVRSVVNKAHARAVSVALGYLNEHAGYTRRASDADKKLMIIDRVEALSGVKYEHRTSRAGDPHVHSHVLLANKQLCSDGKWRTVDSKGIYHEARAAGTIYQAVLRDELSRNLGVEWSGVVNGCAEIRGLDRRGLIESYSTRMGEIEQWVDENKLSRGAPAARLGQKKTRQTKDVSTPLAELEDAWHSMKEADEARGFIDSLRRTNVEVEPQALPSAREVLEKVTADRSTFTRADVVEAVAELMPATGVGAAVGEVVERITDEVLTHEAAWSVTPEQSMMINPTAREGSQRYTFDAVVAEVDYGIGLATKEVHAGVSAAGIEPVEGTLSVSQAEAMRKIVESRFLASVLVAPAGAGKTSSLKAARSAWETAGRTVVGLAPTGKAADVMVGEDVAHTSATIARVLKKVGGYDPEAAAGELGWNRQTVVVVDEAGMVATPELVRVLEVADAAGARVVCVGDPYQYSAVKARGGLLATLSHELPDTAELTEVFRQRDADEREASKRLRTGEVPDVERAADFYRSHGRLQAGSVTAMLTNALEAWKGDVSRGAQSLLVASNRDYVDALNLAAQRFMADSDVLDSSGHVAISSGHQAFVGETVLSRSNNYDMVTSAGDVVRNGQRWQIDAINPDGSATVTRLDGTGAQVVFDREYLQENVQLGYASTGHSAQGATVDVARVVATIGQVDRAGVYVPMTRGREANYLYMAEAMPGDTEAGHGEVEPAERRESADYARDLLIQAATRDRADATPHDVHRQAKTDWTLSRWSLNLPVDADPFAGTEMAEVAKQRADERFERWERYYTPADKKSVHDELPLPSHGVPQGPEPSAEQVYNELHDQERDVGNRLRDAKAEVDRISREHDAVTEKLARLRRKRDQAVDRRENRNLWQRLTNPNAGMDKLGDYDEAITALDKRRDELENELSCARENVDAAETRHADVGENLARTSRQKTTEWVSDIMGPGPRGGFGTQRQTPRSVAVDADEQARDNRNGREDSASEL